MPGRRMMSTPKKPSTIEPARLSVRRSPRISTASSPAHTGIMNSIANTVASGSTITALAQHRLAAKCVPLRTKCTNGRRSTRWANSVGCGSMTARSSASPPMLRTINSSNRLRTPPSWRTEIAISENDNSVPVIQTMTAGRLERFGAPASGGSGSPSAPASTGVTTFLQTLFGVWLVFRPRLVEGGKLEARGVDRGDLRILRHVDLEAPRIEHLRHEAEVRDGDVRAERVRARLDQRLDRVEALQHPMGVPLLRRLLFVLA